MGTNNKGKSTSIKDVTVMEDLIDVVACVACDGLQTSSDSASLDSMNVDLVQGQSRSTCTVAGPQSSLPMVSHYSNSDFLSRLISPLQHGKENLANIPQQKLKENLKPIVMALEKLDAELLLGLERTAQGPRVRTDVCCRPIYDDVKPALPDVRRGKGSQSSFVRYLHISEVPDQYSIGIFVFAPHSRIPLHDHPEMCVLSRILYGDLHRSSLDLARDDNDPAFTGNVFGEKNSSRRTSWWSGWWNTMESFRRKLPKGTKHAFKNHVDHLQAPDVTVLYPYEGNLHEFVAGPDGAAVLDVLLPPYDGSHRRECTFYSIEDVPPSWPVAPSGKEACFVIPSGQPENFHCISGRYGGIRDVDES